MNNRKRTVTLTIRLTELEKAALRHKAVRAKMSLTDFVVSSALRTELDAAENIKPLLAELGRIGRRERRRRLILGRVTGNNRSAARDLPRGVPDRQRHMTADADGDCAQEADRKRSRRKQRRRHDAFADHIVRQSRPKTAALRAS